jgi:hypothetical protein
MMISFASGGLKIKTVKDNNQSGVLSVEPSVFILDRLTTPDFSRAEQNWPF